MNNKNKSYQTGAVYFDKDCLSFFVVVDSAPDNGGDILVLNFDGTNGYTHWEMGEDIEKVSDCLGELVVTEKLKTLESSIVIPFQNNKK